LTSKVEALEQSLEQAQKSGTQKAIKEAEKIMASLKTSYSEMEARCRAHLKEVDESRRQRKILLKENETRTNELVETKANLANLKAQFREFKKDATTKMGDLNRQACSYKKQRDELASKLKDHVSLFNKMRARAFGGSSGRTRVTRSISEELLSGLEENELSTISRHHHTYSSETVNSP
jgi:predicted  nucleic acid-binding Zn-ribbon protein